MTRMRRRGIWPAALTSRTRRWPSGWSRPPRTRAHAVLPPAPRRSPRRRPSSPRTRTARMRGGAALPGWSGLIAAGEFEQVRRLGEKWALDVPARCAGGSPPCARMSSPTQKLPAACSPRRSRTWPGVTRLVPREVGTRCATAWAVFLGRLDEGAFPTPRRSSRRHARPGTPSSCGKRWPPTGSSPRWRARPMPATGCGRRCGFPGSPTRHLPPGPGDDPGHVVPVAR